MKTHELKIETPFFEAIKSGDKTFEVRNNDRGFQKGDILRLTEVDEFGIRRSNYIDVDVTYVLSGWGIKEGYVVLGISKKDKESANSYNYSAGRIIGFDFVDPVTSFTLYIPPFSGVNINDKCKVELTQTGKDVLLEYYQINKCSIIDAELEGKFALWELMKIFGPKIYMGNPKLPFFKENKIVFEK